jgi:hypothetical protein
MEVTTRTISTDPGLLSVEELLAAQSKSQQSALRQLAAQYKDGDDELHGFRLIVRILKEKFRWVLDKAGLKIKV